MLTKSSIPAAIAILLCASCASTSADEPKPRQDVLIDVPAQNGQLPVTEPLEPQAQDLLINGVVNQPLHFNVATEKVKQTYLGVETAKADDTLRAQLKLPAGVGLEVKHVEGPAKDAGVQQHDVLYKLNDQLLINTEQLVVLIRNFKPGEKIELTVIRQAQPVQVSATLVEKEVETLSTNKDWNYTWQGVNTAKALAAPKAKTAR
jgi:hypothetical protein